MLTVTSNGGITRVNEDSVDYLLNHDFTTREINVMLDEENPNWSKIIIALWKESGIKVSEECDKADKFSGEFKDFLTHCTACGGDWGNMLLSGIKELYPDVWNAIPDSMGVHAFVGIVATLNALGIKTEE